MSSTKPCPECKGKGRVSGKICVDCVGLGVVVDDTNWAGSGFSRK